MSPYVVTGKEHKLRKVVNSGTRLCSFIPETRIIIISKAPGPSYVLKTGNDKRGSLKMVSKFPQRESSVWGYLCRRSSLRSFFEIGLTTSLMSSLASSSSGHKNTQIKGLELVSSFRRHLGCCSRLKILKVRLIFTC